MTNYYANVSTGDDSYDGLSATYTGGTNGPKKSFLGAVNTATAAGSGNTVYIAAGTYTGSTVATVSVNLTIVGAGSGSTIRSMSSAQGFNISSGVTVTISGMTFQGGSATYGGMFYNQGTLNLSSCILTNNTSSSSGGVIWNNGTVTASNCTFTSNTSLNGACVNNNTGTVTFTNCTFNSNTATAKGGCFTNLYGSVTATDCTITGNVANNGIDGDPSANNSGNPAGAMFYSQGTSTDYATVIMDGCSVTDNESPYGCGGVLYCYYTALTITDCEFDDNLVGGDFGNGYGGVAHSFRSTITITGNTNFLRNSATTGGGAWCNDLGCKLTMTAGTFVDNVCTGNITKTQYGNGGALYTLDTDGSGTAAVFNGTTFDGNVAEPDSTYTKHVGGGAIRELGGMLKLTNCIFTNNSASAGGGVYKQSGTMLISGCTWSGNTPDDYYPATAPVITPSATEYTDTLLIGPVEIPHAHITDASTYNYKSSATGTSMEHGTIYTKGAFSDTYKFQIVCSQDQAQQIRGLVEQGEMIFINTSDTGDNDSFQHKGWVILTELDVDEENFYTCTCTISYVKISDYENEWLTMDYSNGLYDGVPLETTYIPTSTTTLMDEDGSSTTNWSSIRKGYNSSGTPTASIAAGTDYLGTNDALNLNIQAVTAGTYDYGWVIYNGTNTTFTPPFTLEFTLGYKADSTSSTKIVGVGLCPINYGNTSKYFNLKRSDFMDVYMNLPANASPKYGVRTKTSTTTTTTLVSPTSFTAASNRQVRFKVVYTAAGYVTVYIDIGVTGTYTQLYSGTSKQTNYASGMYLYFFGANKNTSAFYYTLTDVSIVQTEEDTLPNIVMMPPDAILVNSASYSRTVADGISYYYVTPGTELPFRLAPESLHQGTVRLYSSNNDDSEDRQVFGIQDKLVPDAAYIHNGMTKLVFTSSGTEVWGFVAGTWTLINTISEAVYYIKPLSISPERVVLQINESRMIMTRSSPIVTIYHKYTTIPFTYKSYVYHDGALTTGAGSGDSISMSDSGSGYYAYFYESGDDGYFLVLKKDPTTVLNGTLPADDVTGIGWVSASASGYDTADQLGLAWFKQTRTGISLKQII